MNKQKVVIEFQGVSKRYRLGNVGSESLKEDVGKLWNKLRGKKDHQTEFEVELNDRTTSAKSNYVWSLKDINLQINKGDVIGIIGKNGAGKSTLLKLLSKVTSPTKGTIKIQGRIASLLEVGTGFHPELTGRENIYLNGAILGMRKAEINRKLNDIIAFAGVERYIDTPVKRYSSGMYVRLAFAVAAHLESDILIIDEVLAVGDAEFQKKCIGKMKDVSLNEGRTVLFVSHNMDAIARLCNKCIYLKNGQLIAEGNTDKILQSYITAETNTHSSIVYAESDSPGNELVRLKSARIVNADLMEKVNMVIDETIGIQMVFEVLKNTSDLLCGFNLYNHQDVHILSSHDTSNIGFEYTPGVYESTIWIPSNFLSEGMHYCGLAAMSYTPFHVHYHAVGAIGFNVTDKSDGQTVRGSYGGTFPGVVRPQLTWNKIEKIEQHNEQSVRVDR